ncbi:MAG: sigma-70 family RNA polymerase sigma factor [Planctomycetota bacterium]
MQDHELLRDYARTGSESAFAELVRRHIDLVYSLALRQLEDPHAAEDAAQAVFFILARKAKSLRKGTSLAGWLFTTTRYAAGHALRERRRRMHHEGVASIRERADARDSESLWKEAAPFLSEALASLKFRERDAVLLRYCEDNSVDQVARELSISEDAARKRLASGLEKLRGFLRRKGIAIPVGILATLLPSKAVLAAPSGLAGAVASGALAAAEGTALLATTAGLVKGVMKMMLWAKVKTAAVVTVVVLAVGGVSAPAVIRMAGPDSQAPAPDVKSIAQSLSSPGAEEKSPEGEAAPEQSVTMIDIKNWEMNLNLTPGDMIHIGQWRYVSLHEIYNGGKHLRFLRNGMRIEVAVEGAEPHLAGIMVETPEALPELEKILREETGPITVWCLYPVADKIADLPHSDRITFLDMGYNESPDPTALAKLKNLQGLVLTNFKDPVPLASLQNLKVLYLALQSPMDLSPLANLHNLQWIDIFCHEGKIDLSPLQGLKKLRYLRCGTKAKGYDFLRQLTNMSNLDFTFSDISDLSPLENMSVLRRLDITNTPVADLSPLAKVTSLEEISLGTYVHEADIRERPKTGPIDISPLQKLPNLKNLTMYPGATRDFTPLRNMKQLECISGVTDVEILKGLTGLKWLDLSGTEIRDLAWLSNFHNLKGLGLYKVSLPDLAPLAGLARLTNLNLDEVKVRDGDFTPLSQLTNLTNLRLVRMGKIKLGSLAKLKKLHGITLEDTQPADLTPLEGLESLRILWLTRTGISDLTPLRGLVSLRSLYYMDNQSPDPAPLKDLVNLESLSIQPFFDQKAGTIGTIEPVDPAFLAKLTNLQELQLPGIKGSALAPFQDLVFLQELEIQNPEITDLTPLRKLTQLTKLDVSTTAVNDLAPLQNMKYLQELSLYKTQVRDLTPLKGLNYLRYLFLTGTPVSDLSPLTNLPRLATLLLNNTKVSDITPLRNMKSLRSLYLNNTQVADLTPLQNVKTLKILQLRQTKITDLTPLKNLVNLEKLDLRETSVEYEQVVALQKALPKLAIDPYPVPKEGGPAKTEMELF